MPSICGHCQKPIPDDQLTYAQTNHGPRYDGDCWMIVNADDAEIDAKVDRWHDGYFAKTRPTDPDELDGWLHAQNERRVTVSMPARPEGYYHSAPGTFD